MITMQEQLEALMRLCTAEKESDRRKAKQQILEMLEAAQTPDTDPESVIRQLLLELGAPDHLLGHCYMVEALLLCLENRMYINNITFGLYPHIAAKYGTTASRVERAIRHMIEVVWDRGPTDMLDHYFGNTVSIDRGKPTNGEFIARITTVIRQMLKTAA